MAGGDVGHFISILPAASLVAASTLAVGAGCSKPGCLGTDETVISVTVRDSQAHAAICDAAVVATKSSSAMPFVFFASDFPQPDSSAKCGYVGGSGEGEYTIEVTAMGFRAADAKVTVPRGECEGSGQPQHVTIELER